MSDVEYFIDNCHHRILMMRNSTNPFEIIQNEFTSHLRAFTAGRITQKECWDLDMKSLEKADKLRNFIRDL